MKKRDKAIKIAFYVLTCVYGILCLYLFYNQSIRAPYSGSNYFESDLPYHISMVVDDGWYYSLTAFIYLALYKIMGGGTFLIALFLAMVATITVIATERLLHEVTKGDDGINCAGALALNFVMPFFIKWAGMYRYVSYQSPNVWHNSTYICMRLFAVIFLIYYVRYERTYGEKGLKAGQWFTLTILLALTTFVKPSFLTVFAPALLLKLIWDLFKNRVKFIRVFLMGLTVIPSLGIILWQNSVLFADSENSGYKISFMETFSLHADHPKVTVILSLVFPILVFLCILMQLIISKAGENKKEGIKEYSPFMDRTYIFSIIMTVIGFAEAAILVETGSRSRDGNFLWGYSVAMFFIYLMSFKRWYGFLKEKKWISFGICGAAFAYQIVCGAIFFTRLMNGETYFMFY